MRILVGAAGLAADVLRVEIREFLIDQLQLLLLAEDDPALQRQRGLLPFRTKSTPQENKSYAQNENLTLMRTLTFIVQLFTTRLQDL